MRYTTYMTQTTNSNEYVIHISRIDGGYATRNPLTHYSSGGQKSEEVQAEMLELFGSERAVAFAELLAESMDAGQVALSVGDLEIGYAEGGVVMVWTKGPEREGGYPVGERHAFEVNATA
jgi:hypothetical protein